MKEFGRLERVNLRKVWTNEAADFTPWLAEHLPALGEVLGMDLELQEREAGVGDFSLDLLAKDLGTNHLVVIENQLASTDHDHLGKLITYASGFDAAVVVWIAGEIREEHRQALDWLNQHSDSETLFFGVIVEVLQIDDSRPAYNFKLIAYPNEWQKDKRPPGRSTGTGEKYRAYFQALIDELREQHRFTGARAGQPQNWYTFRSGVSGVHYAASFAQGQRARVELYIDQGDRDDNKRLFDWLCGKQAEIEREFGEPVSWERLDERRASRIAAYRPGVITMSDSELAEIRQWQIARLLKLKKVFLPLLKEYGSTENA